MAGSVETRFVEGLNVAAQLGETGRSMLDVALALIGAGWRVFPCNADTKRPFVEHGFKDRSDDRNLIERCWSRLKEYRAVATRYDKTATSYAACIAIAASRCASRCRWRCLGF